MKKRDFKISSQDAIDIARSFPEGQGQQQEPVGVIFDQQEAIKFLEWLDGAEAREIRRKLKAQQGRHE